MTFKRTLRLFRYAFALMKVAVCKSIFFVKTPHLKLFSLNATFAKLSFKKLAQKPLFTKCRLCKRYFKATFIKR